MDFIISPDTLVHFRKAQAIKNIWHIEALISYYQWIKSHGNTVTSWIKKAKSSAITASNTTSFSSQNYAVPILSIVIILSLFINGYTVPCVTPPPPGKKKIVSIHVLIYLLQANKFEKGIHVLHVPFPQHFLASPISSGLAMGNLVHPPPQNFSTSTAPQIPST